MSGRALAVALLALGSAPSARADSAAAATSAAASASATTSSTASASAATSSTASASAVTSSTASASAITSSTASASAVYVAKKDRELADKRARSGPSKLVTHVGQKPAPLVNFQHRWTNEWLAVPARGPLPDAALTARLFRDHYTNQPTDMAGKLFPAVLAAARHFKVARVEIVSAYRHPKYNLILRKKGHEVARDSEHTHGKAVDFRLPGVGAQALAKWALGRRLGGVGTYLQSNFVHIDVGAVRTWSGE